MKAALWRLTLAALVLLGPFAATILIARAISWATHVSGWLVWNASNWGPVISIVIPIFICAAYILNKTYEHEFGRIDPLG